LSAGSHKRGRSPTPAITKERITGAVVGTVTGFERGEVLVSVQNSGKVRLVARTLAGFDDATLQRAARDQAQAVLLFEGGDPSRPLLVGLLRSPTPLVDAILAEPLPSQQEKVARVDGKRVVIEGREEVVLQCGKASLTLRPDGKVVLRGVEVISQADRVNKIRGGKVQIN